MQSQHRNLEKCKGKLNLPVSLTNYDKACKDNPSRNLMNYCDAKREEDKQNDKPCSPGTLSPELQEFYNTQMEIYEHLAASYQTWYNARYEMTCRQKSPYYFALPLKVDFKNPYRNKY